MSANSLPTIGTTLENIKRRLEDMESGDRRHDLAETEKGAPAREVRDLNHTYDSNDDVMPKPLSMQRRIKENQSGTSRQSPTANMTRSYYTHTRSHQVDQTQTKKAGYESVSSFEDD